MKLSNIRIKLLIPAVLFGLCAPAGAADSPKAGPVVKHPLAKSQRVTNKTNQTADESHALQVRERPHHGINADAGVPPSGVPSETMDA
jgi:hypothetical protein